jgi:hypothetical protein
VRGSNDLIRTGFTSTRDWPLHGALPSGRLLPRRSDLLPRPRQSHVTVPTPSPEPHPQSPPIVQPVSMRDRVAGCSLCLHSKVREWTTAIGRTALPEVLLVGRRIGSRISDLIEGYRQQGGGIRQFLCGDGNHCTPITLAVAIVLIILLQFSAQEVHNNPNCR